MAAAAGNKGRLAVQVEKLLRHVAGTAEKAEFNLTAHGKQAITRPPAAIFSLRRNIELPGDSLRRLGGCALLETALGHSKVANTLTMDTQQGASRRPLGRITKGRSV